MESRNVHQVILGVAAVFTVAAFVACSTQRAYSGPARSADETAELKAWGVAFHEVNGEEVSVNSSTVEVLPGENEIRLSINASNYFDSGPDERLHTLVMNAEAGRHYAVTTKRGDGRVCAFPLTMTGDPDFQSPAGCVERQ